MQCFVAKSMEQVVGIALLRREEVTTDTSACFLLCQICKFVTFLLPSSSWLRKLLIGSLRNQDETA